MRWFALLLGLLLSACTGPRYRRVDRPDGEHPPHDPKAPVVWVVLVEGLRAQTLTRYIDRLYAADWEPRWPSGIARLRRADKRLVRARAAMSALETGRGAVATWLSGRTADVHGQSGSRWQGFDDPTLSSGGAITAVNEPLDVQRYFGHALPGGTLFDRLATVRTARVFLPFATPESGIQALPAGGDAISAWIDGPNAEYSGPLVDEAAREAAVHILHAPVLPNLLGIGFRGVFWADDQLAALKRIDGELAEMLEALDRRHPEAVGRLEVLLVGPSPTTELGPTPQRMHGDALKQRLSALAQGCAQPLGRSMLVANGRTVRVRLPRTQAARDCLDRAIRGAALYQSAWLDGAVWRSGETHRTLITQRVQAALGAERTRRLRDRLPAALDAEVDAILFAGAGITFGTERERAVGGITRAALDAAWLWIGDRMESQAVAGFEAAPLRAVDLAPTVLNLFPGADQDRLEGLSAPLMHDAEGVWRFTPVPRLAAPATPKAREIVGEARQPFAAPPVGEVRFDCAKDAAGEPVPKAHFATSTLMTRGANALYWDSRLLEPGEIPASALDPFAVPGEAASTHTVNLAQVLVHHRTVRRAFRLGERRSRRELLARFGQTRATLSPRDAFLSLLRCDALERCVARPLLSDRDFEALVRACR